MFTLQDKFQFKCSIHYNRVINLEFIYLKNRWIALRTLVKPYFVKEMLYKLGL